MHPLQAAALKPGQSHTGSAHTFEGDVCPRDLMLRHGVHS